MQDLKVIRGLVFGIVGVGVGAFLLSLPPMVGLAGGLVVLLLAYVGIRAIDRRASAPPPPKYSDSELKDRVRDALRSKSVGFVEEVRRDVAAQWGDNREYRKLTTKISALRGQRANPEVPRADDPEYLQRLYPGVYGQPEGGNLDEYD